MQLKGARMRQASAHQVPTITPELSSRHACTEALAFVCRQACVTTRQCRVAPEALGGVERGVGEEEQQAALERRVLVREPLAPEQSRRRQRRRRAHHERPPKDAHERAKRLHNLERVGARALSLAETGQDDVEEHNGNSVVHHALAKDDHVEVGVGVLLRKHREDAHGVDRADDGACIAADGVVKVLHAGHAPHCAMLANADGRRNAEAMLPRSTVTVTEALHQRRAC